MKIISHRANDSIHKENTLEAILNSLNSIYNDGIEIDIRLTQDKKFVINHDPFYNGYLISKTKIKKLQKEGINSLEEVLKIIKTNKIIMIEIKHEETNYNTIIKKLPKILSKYNLNYYIQSFNYKLIREFKKNNNNFKCGLIIGISLNLDKINNSLDFLCVNKKHTNIKTKKEVFIWTINNKENLEKIKPNQNIVTDKCKYIYNIIKE